MENQQIQNQYNDSNATNQDKYTYPEGFSALLQYFFQIIIDNQYLTQEFKQDTHNQLQLQAGLKVVILQNLTYWNQILYQKFLPQWSKYTQTYYNYLTINILSLIQIVYLSQKSKIRIFNNIYKIYDLNADKERLNADNQSKQQYINNLIIQIQTKKNSYGILSEKSNELEQLLKRAEYQRQTASKYVKNIQTEIKFVKTQQQRMIQKMAKDYKQKQQNLYKIASVTRLKQLQRRIKDLQKSLTQQQIENKSLKQRELKLIEQNKRIQPLNNVITNLTNEKNGLYQYYTKSHQKYQAYIKTQQKRQLDISNLQKKNQQLKEKYFELKKQSQNLQQRNKFLNYKLEKTDETTKKLKQNLQNKIYGLQKINKALADKNKELTNKQSVTSQQKYSNKVKYQQLNKQKQKQVEDLKIQISKISTSLKQKQHIIKIYKIKSKSQQNQIDKLVSILKKVNVIMNIQTKNKYMNSSLVDKFLGIFNSTNLEKAAQIVSAATQVISQHNLSSQQKLQQPLPQNIQVQTNPKQQNDRTIDFYKNLETTADKQTQQLAHIEAHLTQVIKTVQQQIQNPKQDARQEQINIVQKIKDLQQTVKQTVQTYAQMYDKTTNIVGQYREVVQQLDKQQKRDELAEKQELQKASTKYKVQQQQQQQIKRPIQQQQATLGSKKIKYQSDPSYYLWLKRNG